MYTILEKKTFHLHHLIKSLFILYALLIILQTILCCELNSTDSLVKCNHSVDVKQELMKIRDNISEIDTNMKLDFIKIYSPIDEIPSDVFHDISFRHIIIYNSTALKRIHSNAFDGNTRNYTRFFTCFQNFVSQLRNEPPEYDLYEAITSFVHLQQIYLSLGNHMNHDIPDRVFRPKHRRTSQNSLWFVEWYGYFTISRIGSDVFYDLPNIKSIIFKYATVERIGGHAFRLPEYHFGKQLNITFHNTSLTKDSFEEDALIGSNRKVRLDLTNNFIRVIEEKIFGPFLSENDLNVVILAQNPLNCSDIKSFEWLFDRKHDFEKRILKAVCDNGTKLWDFNQPSDNTESTTTAVNETFPTITEITETETSKTTVVTEADDFETTTRCPHFGTSLCGASDETTTVSEAIGSETVTSDAVSQITTTTNKPIMSSTSVNSASTVSQSTSHSWTDSGSENSQISQISEKIEELIKETEDIHSLNTTEGLKDIIIRIRKIQTSLDSMNSLDFETSLNLTTNILNVLSNLLNQNDAWIKTIDKERTAIASEILLQIQFTSFFGTCNQNNYNQTYDRLINDNIIADMYRNYNKQIHFVANDSSILIPEEVDHWNGITQCGNSSFAALISSLGQYLNESLSSDQNINSQVITYSVTNASDSIEFEQGVSVKFSLKHRTRLSFGDQMICVFWDFSSMEWSTKGCQLLITESNRDVTVCECNHLTNFAAIMDVSNRESDDSLKSILTNVFCGLSLLCLILTIWLLLKPQKNKTNTITNRLVRTRTLITLNLSIMLSIANIFILFGMDRIHNQILCKSMSAILLYALLSSFAWMLLEGYHLYKMTVQVFNSDGRKLFLFLFGYGVPVVVIFIGLLVIWVQDSVLFDALIGDYFCWISSAKYPGHIWILIGPALIAITINILMLITLIRRVFKSKPNPNSNKLRLRIKQIFGMTSLLFNLGITWLSFILYIKQFGSYFSYFSYVFIVLNGSQGIFIFIYHLVIYLSKEKKIKNISLKTSLKLTLSLKWSTKTTQTQLGDN